jgi:hypothetical protein
MKSRLILMMIFVCCAVISGCNKTGTPVEYSKACSSENDNKYIEVSGFLNARSGTFCSNIGGGSVKCGFDFLEKPGDTKTMGADITMGTGANNVEELPKSYKREDIKIHDNNGNVIDFNDKVKLTGKIMVIPGADRCLITVAKIEKQ